MPEDGRMTVQPTESPVVGTRGHPEEQDFGGVPQAPGAEWVGVVALSKALLMPLAGHELSVAPHCQTRPAALVGRHGGTQKPGMARRAVSPWQPRGERAGIPAAPRGWPLTREPPGGPEGRRGSLGSGVQPSEMLGGTMGTRTQAGDPFQRHPLPFFLGSPILPRPGPLPASQAP